MPVDGAADVQFLSGGKDKGGSRGHTLPITGQGKRCTINDTGKRAVCPQSGARQTHFEGRRVGRIADQGIAQCQGRAIRGTSDGHAQAAETRTTKIDHQAEEARFKHAEGHGSGSDRKL